MHVLAIVAHPDDASIFCGGTLAKHADRGDHVTVLHMTRGEYGGFADTTEDELAAVRAEEARRAGDTLGVEVGFLDFKDGRVTDSIENRLRVVEALRAHEPDLVLTHHVDDPHPDHRATSRLVSDAYYMASLPLVDAGGAPMDPDNVYYFGKATSGFDPTTFVDITGYLGAKVVAVQAHESQLEFLRDHGGIDSGFDDVAEDTRARARTLGRRVGASHAEGFIPLQEISQAYLG